MTTLPEPSSFRDQSSRVFHGGDGAVFRALTANALDDWHLLEASGLLEGGDVVGTVLAELPAGAPVADGDPFVAALRHEAVPFVSYPYEWSFGMLQEAALLELRLLLAALDAGMTLKDASPYNVQWRGTRPVFVDVGSFEALRPGEPWEGYRQFCSLFLYPLLLEAYLGVPFNARLRGSVDGIPPAEMRRLLRGRRGLRRGVLTHVTLHASLERRYADRRRDVRGELREAGFGAELIRANARKLERLVRRLQRPDRPSAWRDYGATTSYSDADAARKADFVRAAAAARPRRLVWDLGCNDGRYTRIAAAGAAATVAMDADPAVVDALFAALCAEGAGSVLPLVVDLADPSPALGWRGRERRPLWERGRPDLTLCLAVVHHLAISRNVPLRELLDWLQTLGGEVVVEFVAPEDPMAQRLLAAKRPGLHGDYTLDRFESLLGERFRIERREELASGARVLYHALPAP